MNKSISISEITKALILFHSKVENLKKDAVNPFFRSTYCTLDNIINSIEAPLNASGLTFAQFPSGTNGLTTILMHESGEWIECEYFMKPVKDDPQGSASVITYQRRYALAAVLGLSVDIDDDANRGTHGNKAPQANNYNHTTLSTAQKPLISNLQFKQLIERVEKGEASAYKKALERFTFEATQKRVLEEVFARLIDKQPITINAEII